MSWNDASKIALTFLTALGGGGLIVLSISKYVGKIFADRYIEKVKTKFQIKLDEYQNTLDFLKQISLRYSDKQFEHYSILWVALCELKIAGDALWEEASLSALGNFAKVLILTKQQVEKSAIFIEEIHYNQFQKIFKDFSDYQIGKKKLIQYRRNDEIDPSQIRHMISSNGHLKRNYDTLIIKTRDNLRNQIKGLNSSPIQSESPILD